MDNSLFAHEHLRTETSHGGDHVQGCSHADAGVRCHYFYGVLRGGSILGLVSRRLRFSTSGEASRNGFGSTACSNAASRCDEPLRCSVYSGGDLRSASFTSKFSLSLG